MEKLYSSLFSKLCAPIFLLLFSTLSIQDVYATHGMGADITFSCVAPNIYDVKLTFFRDCSGIVPNPQEILEYSSVSCGVTATINLTQPVGSVIDVTPICPSAVSKCDDPASGVFGFQQYTYTGRITLPTGCGNDWQLGWSNCCRNFAITTLVTPGNQDMYVSASLDNTLSPCNNSPIFNNIPTPIVCVNQPVIYNHGVTDPDGDSLVFSLTSCAQGAGVPVNYDPTFNATIPLLTSGGVSIDPMTGQLTFTPNSEQIGVICVLVEEYRNGVKIGQTVRDMQFSVVNCNNQPPIASGVNGNAGVFDLDLCVGATTCFDIQISDPDGNNVTTSWNNGITGGTFAVLNDGSMNPSATFCWAPTAADLGSHFFTVTVKDDNCFLTGEATYAFTINVVGTSNALNASVDNSICLGDSANLSSSGTGATNFVWTPANGLSDPNIANPRVSPFVTTVYTVQAQYPDGCLGEAQVTVEVNDPPAVSVSPPVSFICPGSSATLTANSPTGTAFSWSTTAVGNSISVSPASSAIYEVYVEDANGCRDTASATVNVNTPGTNLCNVVYVSPGATGTGTAADPGDLTTMLNQVTCNDVVVKMNIGSYNIDNTITNVLGNVTIEGGFDQANGWRKTSQAGATTINRTTANPDGLPNNPRVSVFEISNASNFRIQDLTLTTDDANLPGMSLYGIHLSNCSEYEIVRCQVLVGDAGNGSDGTLGADGLDGEDGVAGSYGGIDDRGNAGPGGKGGDGAGAAGTFGVGGAGGTDQNGGGICCLEGEAGGAGTLATDPRSGGGGGAGGAGGEANSDGGDGGTGAASPTANAGGIGGEFHNSNTGGRSDGSNGSVGTGGADGGDGANGTAGAHVAGFWNPGTAGANGGDGIGGEGGGGGAGGGGQWGSLMLQAFQGAGSGGGGGGGGGEGGQGGNGATAAGSAYGIYAFNNGFNGNIIDCFVQVGTAGTGGTGGGGGTGGDGGGGGLGDDTNGTLFEVGRGGDGGPGGDGGNGGKGGDASDGEAQVYYFNGGLAMASLQTSFSLSTQDVINMDNISCVNTNVNYTAASSAAWNLGGGAVNPTPSGNAVASSYTTTGRKDIVFNGQSYTGFGNISQDDAVIPDADASAPVINGVFRICEGESVDFSALNGTNTYIYHWDLDNGAIPNNYDGTTFQSLNNISFNTADTFYIELRYETDCCGLSDPDTVTLIVDPQPTLALVGPASFCAGEGGVNLTASGSSIYTWAPATSLNTGTGNSVIANPTSTTKYYVTGLNDSQTCSVRDSIVLTVNDLLLAESSTDEGCTPDGTASVVVSGGSGSYAYAWNTSPVQTGATATALATGSYKVVVTDQTTGCKDSTDVFVDKTPGNITAFTNVINPVSCNGLSDGTASVNPSGGSGNYSYTWSPAGGTGATSAPLAAGNYSVRVVDITTGCETTVPLSIPEAPPIAISVLSSTDNDCQTFGEINVNAGGGNGPFTYTWNTTPAQTGPILDSVAAGAYTVTVEDQDGCINNLAVNMQGASPVAVSLVNSQDATSCVINDGSITVSAAGAGTITYNWLTTPPQTGPTISNLFPGSYEVEAISNNGCADTLGITLGPLCPLNNSIVLFEASALEASAALNWRIAQEHAEFKLILERSENGLSFEEFSHFESKDQYGLIDYSFEDHEVRAGGKYFYRIIMEDLEGNRQFSEIREVSFSSEEEIQLIQLYPNPVRDEIWLQLNAQRPGSLHAELYDMKGARISSWTKELEAGEQELKLDVSNAASGVYILILHTNSHWSDRIKLIKE